MKAFGSYNFALIAIYDDNMLGFLGKNKVVKSAEILQVRFLTPWY